MGISAVRPVGIHNRHRLGELLLALVVVGDHQLHAELRAQLRLLHGSNAAVNADDEPDALGGQLVNGDGVQAVALLQTGGDVADHIRALGAQKIRQQAGCGDAVDVIVAEHGDLFAPFDGKPHPSRSQIHIRHQKRVEQLRAAVEIGAGLSDVLDAPGSEHHRAQRRIPSRHQRIHRAHPGRLYIPDSILQGNTHPL